MAAGAIGETRDTSQTTLCSQALGPPPATWAWASTWTSGAGLLLGAHFSPAPRCTSPSSALGMGGGGAGCSSNPRRKLCVGKDGWGSLCPLGASCCHDCAGALSLQPGRTDTRQTDSAICWATGVGTWGPSLWYLWHPALAPPWPGEPRGQSPFTGHSGLADPLHPEAPSGSGTRQARGALSAPPPAPRLQVSGW